MAKTASPTEVLLVKLTRALDKSRMNDAADILFKLSSASPKDLPRDKLHGHYFRVLNQVLKLELKPLARELLRKLAAEPDLTVDQRRRIGEAWLAIGDEAEALALALRIEDHELLKVLRARALDQAVIDPAPPASTLLSPELVAEIGTFREAFAAYEVGNAEAAREKLQGIGMASPLMEWKLMLRGLIAYAAVEDSKAVENWSRLKLDRLPAQLVAPLRVFVDSNAPRQLPAEHQSRMVRHTEVLLGPVMGNLAKIQSLVSLDQAREPLFRAAKEVAGELRTVSKRAFITLSSVVYWSIYSHGQPHEMAAFEQAFGKPERDPKFHRLQGLVGERLRDFHLAHAMWSEYERWVLRNPQFFPIPLLNRIRGTLQMKIGRLALDLRSMPAFPEDLFDIFGRGAPLLRPNTPSPESALRSAMELMPDDPQPVRDLFDYLLTTDRKADQHKHALLMEERFSNDVDSLQRLEVYFLGTGDFERAQNCLRKGISLNPLDKMLRFRERLMGLTLARASASDGDFDTARRRLDEIRDVPSIATDVFVTSIAALRGVMAAKEKDKATWEAIKADLTNEQNRIPGIYLLLAEGSRVKLPKKELDGFFAEFKADLAKPATPSELNAFVGAVSQYRLDPKPYRGLKAHEKLVEAAIVSAAGRVVAEKDLQTLATMLHSGRMYKSLKEVARRGVGLFPQNAYFWFFEAEAIQAPKNPEMIVRSANRPYTKAHGLMDKETTRDYDLLRDLWEARLVQTPDLQALIDDLGDGYYF